MDIGGDNYASGEGRFDELERVLRIFPSPSLYKLVEEYELILGKERWFKYYINKILKTLRN